MNINKNLFSRVNWIVKSLTIFFISLVIRSIYLYVRGGFRYSGDTEWHVRTCSYLFHNLIGVESVGEGLVAGINYYGYILPMCTTRYLFGIEYWGWILIIVSSTTPVVIYFAARRMFNDIVGMLSALFLATSWSVFRWSQQLMTEPLFLLVIALAFWRIILYSQVRTTRNRILMYSTIGWGCLVRPFGIPFLIIGLGFYSPYYFNSTKNFETDDTIHTISLIFSSVVVFISAFVSRSTERLLLDGYIFPNGEAPPGVLIPGKIDLTAGSDLLPGFMNQLILIFVTIIIRLISTFYPSRYFWDLERTVPLVNTILYIPLIPLFFMGIFKMSKSDNEINFKILIAPVIAILIIVSATWMEGRFRWRASMMPSIVIFSGYSVYEIYRTKFANFSD